MRLPKGGQRQQPLSRKPRPCPCLNRTRPPDRQTGLAGPGASKPKGRVNPLPLLSVMGAKRVYHEGCPNNLKGEAMAYTTRRRSSSWPNPQHSGSKPSGDGSSWVNWWLFSPPLTEAQSEEFIEDNDLYGFAGEPGSTFSRGADVRTTLTRTLITESGGWDV